MKYVKEILSCSYLINLIINVLSLKSINYFYKIDNIFFNCLIFGIYFPFNLIYFFIKQDKLYKINCVIGFLDYILLILFYIGLNNLNVGEYLSYRTLSIVFNVILSYFFLNKKFSFFELFGIIIILFVCLLLIFFSGIKNIFYTFIILLSSFIYSLSSYFIEKNKDFNQIDFLQIKLISSFFSLITCFYYNLFFTNIYFYLKSYDLYLYSLILFVGITEYIFYFLKNEIIKNVNNGSVFINILDIIRRVFIFGFSYFIFNEIYQSYMYIFYLLLLFGCIIYNFAFYIHNFLNIIKNKFFNYYTFNQINYV